MNPGGLAIPESIATSQIFEVDYATRRGLLHGLIVLVRAPVKERTQRNQYFSFLVS
jgi:hypothetical protein